MLKVWYNGKFGAPEPCARRQNKKAEVTTSAFFWVSLRLVPEFTHPRSLVHTCIPHNGATMRSEVFVGLVLFGQLATTHLSVVALPLPYVIILPHLVEFVKRFLRKIRNFFSVVFATTHLYRVLLPSVGCFLLYSPLHSQRTSGRGTIRLSTPWAYSLGFLLTFIL